MKIALHSLVLLLVLAAALSASAQTTWYVDDDCAPPGGGTELNPFCTIQDGVNAASNGNTVLVGPGTYTGDGNRDISLFGKTITLKSTDGPDATTIDIEGNPQSIHRGFFLIHGETPDTIIEGFTIINAYLIGDTGGTGPGGGGGGAIYIRDSSPTVTRCIIRDNISATLNPPFPVDGRGAGIYVDGNSSAVIENCVIADNVAARRGGGMYIGYDKSAVVVRNCLITGNSGSAGGGIYNTFGSTSVLNTSIINNTKVISGGGIHNEGGEPILNNCVLWGNEAISRAQIFIQGPILTIDHSNVQGGLAEVDGCCNEEISWGPGMIDAEPLFVDLENGDFRFLHGSPCIDAGNNLAVPEGVVADLDGDPRFLDDPDTPDTGNPDPDAPELPIVDMGPYEYDPDDCNNNDIPDADDIDNETSIDCDENGIPDDCEVDCNDNGQVDACDVSQGSSDDCNGNVIPDECEIDQDSPAPGGPFYCDTSVQDCDPDCNENGQPDSCDIADESSEDCDGSGVPDECEPDCNGNGVQDVCDIAGGTSQDCGGEGIPDDCPENPGPVITAQPADQEVQPGDLAFFVLAADGIQLEYQWRKDGENLEDDGRIIGAQTPGLIILDVERTDAGEYDCEVTDFADDCALSNPATLTVTDSCPADFDDDGTVGAFDLAFLLGAWGPCPDTCPADLSNDGTVEAFDLAQLLGDWGPCP